MENWNYTKRFLTAAIDDFLKHRKIRCGPDSELNYEVLFAFASHQSKAESSRKDGEESDRRLTFMVVLLERFSDWKGERFIPSKPLARDFVYVLEPVPTEAFHDREEDYNNLDDWLHPIMDAVGVALARMGIETGIRMVES